ncbi:LacI family DNA-binding transcriptional regulator [Coraliomargarita parva]|uniref:LacI family DNA-binding transcriptional regulator n=1 Tax=Coraliomargarita parva TaxID=3014050 RepID=UPI0022B366B6|nr:LacI family DNA-binding transcriptional regulator [Coraliomargarita parva]
MASIKDVAREAGVSIATVSRMLANKGYISDDTRQKVQTAVDKLGYRPNRVAQRLREQQSRILALIVSDIQNPFFGQLCRAVENFAQKRGLCVFVCNTDEDSGREQHYLELMAQEQVAGIIISPSSKGSQQLEALQKSKIPVVTVDRRASDQFDSVLIDNTESAQKLTLRVLAGGYRRIAAIVGANSFTASERLSGIEAALATAGLKPHKILTTPAFEPEGQAAMESLLDDADPPDAVICSSALLATGAYRAIHQRNIQVPETLGFACFDDPPWATFIRPGLTVIQQPAALIGETAAELLMKRIEQPDRSPSLIRLQGKLIERGSLR